MVSSACQEFLNHPHLPTLVGRHVTNSSVTTGRTATKDLYLRPRPCPCQGQAVMPRRSASRTHGKLTFQPGFEPRPQSILSTKWGLAKNASMLPIRPPRHMSRVMSPLVTWWCRHRRTDDDYTAMKVARDRSPIRHSPTQGRKRGYLCFKAMGTFSYFLSAQCFAGLR